MKAKILKKFEDEVAGLERELHHDLPKEIQRARELGDLRENAEYQAAKERQRLVESRISMLQKRVSKRLRMRSSARRTRSLTKPQRARPACFHSAHTRVRESTVLPSASGAAAQPLTLALSSKRAS